MICAQNGQHVTCSLVLSSISAHFISTVPSFCLIQAFYQTGRTPWGRTSQEGGFTIPPAAHNAWWDGHAAGRGGWPWTETFSSCTIQKIRIYVTVSLSQMPTVPCERPTRGHLRQSKWRRCHLRTSQIDSIACQSWKVALCARSLGKINVQCSLGPQSAITYYEPCQFNWSAVLKVLCKLCAVNYLMHFQEYLNSMHSKLFSLEDENSLLNWRWMERLFSPVRNYVYSSCYKMRERPNWLRLRKEGLQAESTNS